MTVTVIEESYEDTVIKLAERTILFAKARKSPLKRIEFDEITVNETNIEEGRNLIMDVQDYLWSKGISCYRRDRDTVLVTSLLSRYQTLNWFFYVKTELFRIAVLLIMMTVFNDQSRLVYITCGIIGFLWSGALKLIPLTLSYYMQSYRGYNVWTNKATTLFSKKS